MTFRARMMTGGVTSLVLLGMGTLLLTEGERGFGAGLAFLGMFRLYFLLKQAGLFDDERDDDEDDDA